MSRNEVIRRHYRFYGDVQGVGFRWHARNAADAAGASGWVRNEPDGSVCMELEGQQEQIDAVLDHICSDPWIRVDHMEVTELAPLRSECGFRVRF